jgi:hypothetical protein
LSQFRSLKKDLIEEISSSLEESKKSKDSNENAENAAGSVVKEEVKQATV